jgi:hypothetical protein
LYVLHLVLLLLGTGAGCGWLRFTGWKVLRTFL